MTTLILGGCGYLGSMLSKRLLENHHNVTIVDNLLYKQGHLVSNILLNKNCEFYNQDIMETHSNILKKANRIYLLSAWVGGPKCNQDLKEAYRVNVESVKWLIPKLSKQQKVIFACSSSGYGIQEEICTEKTPMNSISEYGRQKEQAEEIILNHPNSCSIRLATVYGRSLRHRFDLLVNDLTWQAVKYKKISLYQGNFKRAYININEVISIFLRAGKLPHGVYNAVGDNCSKASLIDKIKFYLPETEIEYTDQEDFDKRNYFIDDSKLRGYMSKCIRTLDYSLKELIDYYNLLDISVENDKSMRNI